MQDAHNTVHKKKKNTGLIEKDVDGTLNPLLSGSPTVEPSFPVFEESLCRNNFLGGASRPYPNRRII